jgi:hypothetical protein
MKYTLCTILLLIVIIDISIILYIDKIATKLDMKVDTVYINKTDTLIIATDTVTVLPQNTKQYVIYLYEKSKLADEYFGEFIGYEEYRNKIENLNYLRNKYLLKAKRNAK